MRGTDEAFSAPERIVEIGAVALQFSGEAAVYDGAAAALPEKIGHEGSHFSSFFTHAFGWNYWPAFCSALATRANFLEAFIARGTYVEIT